jgi:hypothetical protein
MKIKIKALIRGASFAANPGDVRMVDDKFSRALISANAAELIEDPAAPIVEKAISVPVIEKAEVVAQKPKPAPKTTTTASKSKPKPKAKKK